MSGAEELSRLAGALGKAGDGIMADLQPVMKRAAQNIKTDLQSNLQASKHFKGAAGSISYDRTDLSPTSVAYEVGPDKARGRVSSKEGRKKTTSYKGGAVANIAFFGTSRGGGTVDLEGPLYAEMPNLAREAMNLLKGWDR